MSPDIAILVHICSIRHCSYKLLLKEATIQECHLLEILALIDVK